jgi:hypothetical protein
MWGYLTVAEDEQLVAVTGSDLAHEWEEVIGDTLGVLAHDAGRVGTAGVEVAEQGAVPLLKGLASFLQVVALGFDVVCDDILDHGLGSAISVGGTDRAVLGNGDHILEAGGVAVDGSRGGEDNVGDIVLGHGAQQGDAAPDIDAVVLEGDLARFADGLATG